jgi:tetratricopeptide (TPR) repeat protein
MRIRALSVLFLGLAFCALARAGQPDRGPIFSDTTSDPNDPNYLKILMESMPTTHVTRDKIQFDEKGKRPVAPEIPLDPNGAGNVPKSRAMLCPICKQPLWKHDLDGFVCTPLDENGNPRKVLTISLVNTVCPVCKAPFKGALPENINSKGGIDRDFCVHSVGKYTVDSTVWLCPECGYAAMTDAFKADAKQPDEAVKTFVRTTLSDPMHKRMIDVAGLVPEKATEDMLKFGAYIDQTQIPDWIKYDNAVKIYEQMKAPRGFLATLYRDAAHACRREVYNEISIPGLSGTLQESLSKSIRRMNRYLQEGCFNIRRAEGVSILDPTVMETDAAVLAQAATEIVRQAEEAYNRAVAAEQNNNGAPTSPERYFTTGDMYVLHICYAGILDRLGKLDESEKALRRANSFIPEHVDPAAHNGPRQPGMEEAYERQLRLLHGVIEDRLSCLQKEKDYLFKAAKANMTAIMLKEITFDENPAPPAPNATSPTSLDAAPASYLLGELFRRAGENAAALAWFDAASKIVKHRIVAIEKEEQKSPEAAQPAHPARVDQGAARDD